MYLQIFTKISVVTPAEAAVQVAFLNAGQKHAGMTMECSGRLSLFVVTLCGHGGSPE
jgi:hypothetical protein